MIKKVVFSRKALKCLRSIPDYIFLRLQAWVDDVEENGLEVARMNPGYHDESLQGKRFGQRSVRLNRAYRAIYQLDKDSVVFVLILEVNKHDY